MASFFFIATLCAIFLELFASEPPFYTPMANMNAGIDLKGQMFSLNEGSSVVLQSTSVVSLPSFTVCLRYISEYNEPKALFAFGFGSQYDVILESKDYSDLKLTVGTEAVTFQNFYFPFYNQNSPWTAFCSTWMSSTGMAQLWQNGSPSVRKGVARGQVLSGKAFLALYGFIGQVADVNIWNYVLAPNVIASYSKGAVVQQGTVLNWRNAVYGTSGYVIVEPMQYLPALSCCASTPSFENSAGVEESKQKVVKKLGFGNRNGRKIMLGKGVDGATVL